MRVLETTIPGVLVVEPVVHGDERGFFVETFQAERYPEAGIPGAGGPPAWAQLNQSRSRRGTLRGLHTQIRRPQGKLVRAARGAIYDVVLDLRPGSPAFGRWEAHVLDDEAHRQLWVPPGLAHGFCVTSPEADVVYACTSLYDGADEGGVHPFDPDLGIPWPVADALLSEKDRRLPRLRDLGPEALPHAPFAP